MPDSVYSPSLLPDPITLILSPSAKSPNPLLLSVIVSALPPPSTNAIPVPDALAVVVSIASVIKGLYRAVYSTLSPLVISSSGYISCLP